MAFSGMQNQCLWQCTPSPVCYLARMQGDTWGSAGGARWKWEVSLTSTADSCSWISKNSCERWQVLIIFYSLSQSPGTHCNYVVSHSVKFCHCRSLAARKEKLNNIDSRARALVRHKGKNVFPAWLFYSVCFLFFFFPLQRTDVEKTCLCLSMKKMVFSEAAFEVSWGRGEKNQWLEKTLPGTSAARGGLSSATHEETSGALQDSDTRVNANRGGCDKQSEPEPKSLQMDQHQTR